ncbi:sel1 repeat family protein, partial [Pseudomonas sp. SIMBA_077]
LLEPATGRAMPDSSAFIKASHPVPSCLSGQPCPQTGYWRAVSVHGEVYCGLSGKVVRRFEANQIMPTLAVKHRERRFLFADRITVRDEKIQWHLLG